uniref:hypothetical protein n=1 Tax=Okeania sp. SIO2F4 TaxID=2607790 RepID=UPI0025FD3C91
MHHCFFYQSLNSFFLVSYQPYLFPKVSTIAVEAKSADIIEKNYLGKIMPAPYSYDLRQKVIKAIDGGISK